MSFPTGQEAESSLFLESPQLCRQLMLSEIQAATQNFDESLIIGRGGFGKVYKGTIINGTSLLKVAIKRLDSTSNQGALEFWAEVEMLSKLTHYHLVSLIGYCSDEQEMILVYEYMSHGSLEDHLHKRGTCLSWVRRLKICIGAARGLNYLHTGTGIKHGVIHRDVKSSNILLHNSWAAKISDFGLCKICPIDQSSTHVNTLVKGTFGYLDPDYFSTGKLTRKSDVYAFGVVLFEVLCGKKAVDESIDDERWGLAGWAQDAIKEGRLKQIVDTNLIGTVSPKCLKKFAQLADRCLHSHPKRRPTMAEVVVHLEFVLAVQEKATVKLQPADMTMLENSVGVSSLKSLYIYLDKVGGENRILRRFDFYTINDATKDFAEANIISGHRFGDLYKGRLQNGRDIAIATCYNSKHKHILNEVSILVQLEHENLFQLLGYCIHGTKFFLIYEFAPYASLGLLLSDPMCTLLDWNKRYKILLAVARVLAYLHKHAPIRIIHCDVKPNNILLDEKLNPKLCGFGIAKCFAINEIDHCMADDVYGTKGYMAPEYERDRHLSTKVDVFSFGLVVLETVRGLKSSILETPEMLEFYGWRNWWEGTSSNIIHPRIDVDSNSITRFIEIGLMCTQVDVTDRPTMEEVVDMVLGNSSPTPLLNTRRIRTITKKIEERNIKHNLDSINMSIYDYIDDYDTGAVEEFILDLSPR